MEMARTLAVAAIAAVTAPTVTHAATVARTYTVEMPFLGVAGQTVNPVFSRSQLIQPFDTGLGELTGVRISSSGHALVSMYLGVIPDTCIGGTCFPHSGEGNAMTVLRSTFLTGGAALWSTGDVDSLHVGNPGSSKDEALLEYSFDQGYADPLDLGLFGGSPGSLRIDYEVSINGAFEGEFDPDNSIAGATSSFSTTVIYDYIPGTTPGAVPEPSTWAMMILGFGLVCGGLRRRGLAGAAFPA